MWSGGMGASTAMNPNNPWMKLMGIVQHRERRHHAESSNAQ